MEKDNQIYEKWNKKTLQLIYIMIVLIAICEMLYYAIVVRPFEINKYGVASGNYFQFVIMLPFALHSIFAYIITKIYSGVENKNSNLIKGLIQFLFVWMILDIVFIHRDMNILYSFLLVPIVFSIIYRNHIYIIVTTIIELAIAWGINIFNVSYYPYTRNKTYLNMENLIGLTIVAVVVAIATILIRERASSIESIAVQKSNKYKKIFMNLPIGFAQAEIFPDVIFGESLYKIVDANEQFRKYFDLLPYDFEADFLSRSKVDVLRDMNAWFDAYNRTASEDEVLNVEIEIEKLGKVFNTIMYKDEKNRINMVLTDVTQQKETESKLSQAIKDANAAYKTQGEFLANMSHEIRTPINGILGMLQLTLMADDLQDDYRDNLLTAKGCADTLLRLINDILDFTKLEAGKYKIKYEEFNITEVIENTVAIQIPIANDKGLTLDCNVAHNIPRKLKSDPQRVEQILNCLLSNAIKFTSTGGVRVKVAFINDTDNSIIVRIAVADSGIGIAEIDKDKLFKRFSQVDSSNTRKYGGTGLGLVITKQIVELMHGSITVQSKEDVGSTFIVELPMEVIETSEDENKPENEPVFAINGKNKVRVLVAEDEPVNQQVIGKLLGMAGYSYDIAENGKVAIELYKKKGFDIALFDVQMPVMDGLEATKRIRKYEQENHFLRMPIVAVTARAMFGDKEKILDAELDDYIAKPYSLNDIVKVIEKYTGNKSQQ